VPVYPISSAACERRFSQIKLQQTGHKNSLRLKRSISSLLIISVSGPPLEHWIYNRWHCVRGLGLIRQSSTNFLA